MSYDRLSNKEKIIFLSGVFDGEGSFGMWSNGKNRPRYLVLKVETTDSDMVSRFKEVFGGTFYTVKARKAHWKNSFIWKVVGEEAWKTLEQMIPYMCLRRRMKFNALFKPKGFGQDDWGSLKEVKNKNDSMGFTRSGS